ncbi:hypothetical protein TrVE_jg138 [Triparma verrucosa]|uniref:Uncharacterized protein n=1 Tax=Triparma verrucosa TaxID=1606542 RepID=A0A9W7FIP1_9STRA|nr:hypothetical protein TrVE_jg138 [Triparma verrucosa]
MQKGIVPHTTKACKALPPSAKKGGFRPDSYFKPSPPESPPVVLSPGSPFDPDEDHEKENKIKRDFDADLSEVNSIDAVEAVVSRQRCAILKVEADIRKTEVKMATFKDNAEQRQRERENEAHQREMKKLDIEMKDKENAAKNTQTERAAHAKIAVEEAKVNIRSDGKLKETERRQARLRDTTGGMMGYTPSRFGAHAPNPYNPASLGQYGQQHQSYPSHGYGYQAPPPYHFYPPAPMTPHGQGYAPQQPNNSPQSGLDAGMAEREMRRDCLINKDK